MSDTRVVKRLLASQFPATTCTWYPRFECTRSRGHTQVFKTQQQKSLAHQCSSKSTISARNCLLSQSCHHCLVGAIIGPHPIHTRKCVWICASVRVLTLVRQGCLLHARVNVHGRPPESPSRYSHLFVELLVIGIVHVYLASHHWPTHTQVSGSSIKTGLLGDGQ